MTHALPPHDPLLPQLPQALDGDTMARVFDALRAPASPGGVTGCIVERVKYRPRRNLAVTYRLAVRDPGTGLVGERRVAARFCAGGESARRFAKVVPRAIDAAPSGPAVSHWPALDMVAFWWPHDPKLGVAAHLLGDPQRLRAQALPELAAALTDGHGRVLAHSQAIVQVVAEHRVSARVTLQIEPAPGAAAVTQIVYAKADAERRGGVTHAVMAALARSPAAAQGRLLTPRPLLWQPACGLHWQAELDGRMLLDVEPALAPATAARVGTLLHALHTTPVPAARRCSFAALRERLATVVDTLALVEPGWAPNLQALAAHLDSGFHSLTGSRQATLHGDLHPRNILVDGERLGLIDFDSVREGPALLDVGDWVADALYRALLDGRDTGDALPACRAFVEAYAAAARSAIAPAALAWSTAHSLLVQRAWRCVVNLKPGRLALVPALLSLCDALLRTGSIDAADVAWREAA